MTSLDYIWKQIEELLRTDRLDEAESLWEEWGSRLYRAGLGYAYPELRQASLSRRRVQFEAAYTSWWSTRDQSDSEAASRHKAQMAEIGNRSLTEIKELLAAMRSEQASEHLRTFLEVLKPEIFRALSDWHVKRIRRPYLERQHSEELARLLQQGRFSEAESLHQKQKMLTEEQFRRLKDVWSAGHVQELKSLLEKWDFKLADDLHHQRKILDEAVYVSLRRPYIEEWHVQQLTSLLQSHDFKGADSEYSRRGIISDSRYCAMKAPYIVRAMKGAFRHDLSDEQAIALARPGGQILVTARAGSGKTTTIAAKVAFLCKYYMIKPQEILVMAFNKKAADDIADRVAVALQIDHFPNAMTFHALAHRIVRPEPDQLLVDSKDGGRLTQSEYVHSLVRRLWNPAFREELYRHFRKELEEIEERGHNLGNAEYLLFRRNLRHLTLRGERVKSLGEKIIADFLCEHGIRYVYEKNFWTKREGKSIKPDFTLLDCGRDIVIEHWGVDENSPGSAPRWWDQSGEQYVRQMHDKRAYFRSENIVLVETSIRDMRGGASGRAFFEHVLAERLKSCGVECNRLSDDQLSKEIVDPKRDKIAGMFLSFIQNVKRRQLDCRALNEAIRNEHRERVKVFHELALRIYSEYCKDMIQTNKIDFDDLLSLAARSVRQLGGDVSIKAQKWHFRLNQIRWILIDEYQDFSPLFFDLIKAIRDYNHDCKVFCVGDDWQAINGFAGSDLEYFQQFEKYFEEAGHSHITINRRSSRDIIEYGNRLMYGRGEPAKFDSDADRGEVSKIDIQDPKIAFVEFRSERITDNHPDRKFLWFWDERSNKADLSLQNASKFLKVSYEIIREHAGKSVFIISRRNDIDYADCAEFTQKLKRCFSKEELKRIGSFEEKVQLMTAHRTKGLEADIVIILDVCQGVFPLLHPDYALSEVFGFTPQRILEEERRLMYVAITRARERTYVVTDSSNPSDFLKEMNL